MKPERIQLDSSSPDPAHRLVRYEGGLGDVVTVQLRQAGRIARFDLEDERVRELPAPDAGDLLEQRRHFVELSTDERFVARFEIDAVPADVERDAEGRIVHTAATLATVIDARRTSKKSTAKKAALKEKTTAKKTEKR